MEKVWWPLQKVQSRHGGNAEEGSRFEDHRTLVTVLTLEYLLIQIGLDLLITYVLNVTPQRDKQD